MSAAAEVMDKQMNRQTDGHHHCEKLLQQGLITAYCPSAAKHTS